MSALLHAFEGYGIELEYMIVDRASLSVRPDAERLLSLLHPTIKADGTPLGWSNELVAHVVEVKNRKPSATLEPLLAGFEAEIVRANAALYASGARLMPTAMHPWMDPIVETVLWPYDEGGIYSAYDRIFNCRSAGWANVQSMHLNLPFAGDAEFGRLHAAIRLVLPILPALAASSPIAQGRRAAALDQRMVAYRYNAGAIPAITGQIIPDAVRTRARYESDILQPMYAAIAPHDPTGALRFEWLNSHGAIARFDRSAIELRVLDVQECPLADLAIAAAVASVVRAVYEREIGGGEPQNAIATSALARILDACVQDADRAPVTDAAYLSLIGYPGAPCTAGALWAHLIADCPPEAPVHAPAFRDALDVILDDGPLARRIMRAVGPSITRDRLHRVYGRLCDCLQTGRLFTPA